MRRSRWRAHDDEVARGPRGHHPLAEHPPQMIERRDLVLRQLGEGVDQPLTPGIRTFTAPAPRDRATPSPGSPRSRPPASSSTSWLLARHRMVCEEPSDAGAVDGSSAPGHLRPPRPSTLEQAADRVHPVLRLAARPAALRPVEHRGGDLLATVRRQAVQHDRVRRRAGLQVRRRSGIRRTPYASQRLGLSRPSRPRRRCRGRRAPRAPPRVPRRARARLRVRRRMPCRRVEAVTRRRGDRIAHRRRAPAQERANGQTLFASPM